MQPIVQPPPRAIFAQATRGVQVEFVPGMAVAHPRGRHSTDDVVVIDPAIVIYFYVVDIAMTADARTAEGEQSSWIARYVRQFATPGADRRHRAAQGMSRKP